MLRLRQTMRLSYSISSQCTSARKTSNIISGKQRFGSLIFWGSISLRSLHLCKVCNAWYDSCNPFATFSILAMESLLWNVPHVWGRCSCSLHICNHTIIIALDLKFMICCDCDVEVRGGGKSENTERNICQKSFCRNFVFVEFTVSLGNLFGYKNYSRIFIIHFSI